MSTQTVIEDGDIYWDMHWHTSKRPDGSLLFPDKPETERHFEEDRALARLIAEEVCSTNEHWWKKDWPEEARKTFAIFVNCNDIFAWGCADAEPLQHDEIQDLYDHWIKDRNLGPAVWCCKKRRQMPQAPVRKAIEAAGIWNLSEMGLEPNGYDAAMRVSRPASPTVAKK